MNISGKTKILGIFGYPIEHTLSPAMHNAAIEALGVDMVYLPFEVRPERLGMAVEAIRSLDILGVNVTIPHKSVVIPYLDRISEEARVIGAINTIVNREGELIGYNTDGEGYVRSLKRELGFDFKGKTVLLLGAGGAARGILVSIAREGPKDVIVANRTIAKASALVRELKGQFPDVGVTALGLIPEILKVHMGGTTLLINTTSLGMRGEGIGLPLDALPGDAVVSDIVYRPLMTPLLKEASALGLITHNGLGMLVEQGALSLKLWTGLDAPREIMREVVLKSLDPW